MPDRSVPKTEPDLQWENLRYFLVLARRRTLTPAARLLGVAHTTVLRRVAQLEASLDRKLFERSSVGFHLTQAGRELLPQAEAMERLAEKISNQGSQVGELAGAVRIASFEGLADRVLVPLVASLIREHPLIDIEVLTMSRPANLRLREADIVIGPHRLTGRAVSSSRLTTCPVRLYASRAYLERYGIPSSTADLDGHVFVDYIEDLVEFPELKWIKETVGNRSVRLRSTSSLAQLRAVHAGIGIGMFPQYMVGEPEIVAILPNILSADRDYWISMHDHHWAVPRMEIVARALSRALPAQLSEVREFGDTESNGTNP